MSQNSPTSILVQGIGKAYYNKRWERDMRNQFLQLGSWRARQLKYSTTHLNRVDYRDLFTFVEWSASHLNQSKYSTPPLDAVEA
jgi:hypothetical protein